MKFFKNLSKYLTAPEIVAFYIYLFSTAILLIINFLFLELAWFLISSVIVLLTAIALFVVAVRDTEINLKLRLEKSRLDNIISSMTDGVIIYDDKFRILLFSGGAENIFNISSREVTGKEFLPENVDDPKSGVLARIIFQSLAPLVVRHTPEGVYPQIVDISFEDPHLELKVITDRIKDERGEEIGFLKIVHDQTREIDLLKSKGEFITVAAHQFRTPLSAVSWALQSLKSEPLAEGQQEIVNTGLAAANNLMKIVDDLLNISRVEEGRFGYNFKRIDVIKFLQSALDQVVPVAREYGVSIYMEQPKDAALMVYADPEKLNLVISNLLENAIKYNVVNGQAVVSVDQQEGTPFVQVSVADTGMWIPQEAMGRLFGKFFRAENAISKETSGSGLGLYITQNIIRKHGGQIWAESVINRGTTFHFTLPTDQRLIPQMAYTKLSEEIPEEKQ
jgi:signal transduction histidine kinase